MAVKIKLFDIQRFSLHDGPGIRTTVFFRGCPLRCPWCSNPESQRGRVELLHFANKCTACGRCGRACPHGAVEFWSGPVFHREKCRACGACARACLSGALKLSGEEKTVGEILAVVRRDMPYYRRTGGGVTFSGGEPLLQPEGLHALLEEAKAEGIHTAIETAGNVPESHFRKALGLADLFLFDLKHADPDTLRRVTGGDLEGILHNLALAAENGRVQVRVPVIPGFNRSPPVLEGIFALAAKRGVREADLLPYHVLGRGKYSQLGRTYTLGEEKPLEKADLLPYVQLGEARGIHVTISGKEAAQIKKEAQCK